MGDNAVVKKLIELLSKYLIEKNCDEKDLPYPMTKDFFRNFQNVLSKKQLVTINRWRAPFAISHSQMHSTPEMYLRYTIYACRQEARIQLNVFERFLSVVALILNLRVVTLWKPSVDFQKLMPDIFMAFYDSELKKPFKRCGGFRRLVEYINNPKYLAENCLAGNASSKSSGCETNKQKQRKSLDVTTLPSDIKIEDAEIDELSITLSQKILKDVEFKSCLFLGDSDPMIELFKHTNQKLNQLNKERSLIKEQMENLEKKRQLLLSLYSNSSEQDNIIRRVIMYNRLNSSGPASENNYLQKEVHDILNNLEDRIKYLLEFLDDYNKD